MTRRACCAFTRFMSRSRGCSSACLTARSVISLKVSRWIGRRTGFRVWARCQAIASPSRSGSGASRMRPALRAAALIFASAWLLPRMGTYLGSKPFSTSTPSSLLGRSMMWPLEAKTENPRPRNLVSVRDLAGDSTITSDRSGPPVLPAARLGAALFAAAFCGSAFLRALFLGAALAGAALASSETRVPRFVAGRPPGFRVACFTQLSFLGSARRGSVGDVLFSRRAVQGAPGLRERDAHRHLVGHLDSHRTN